MRNYLTSTALPSYPRPPGWREIVSLIAETLREVALLCRVLRMRLDGAQALREGGR